MTLAELTVAIGVPGEAEALRIVVSAAGALSDCGFRQRGWSARLIDVLAVDAGGEIMLAAEPPERADGLGPEPEGRTGATGDQEPSLSQALLMLLDDLTGSRPVSGALARARLTLNGRADALGVGDLVTAFEPLAADDLSLWTAAECSDGELAGDRDPAVNLDQSPPACRRGRAPAEVSSSRVMPGLRSIASRAGAGKIAVLLLGVTALVVAAALALGQEPGEASASTPDATPDSRSEVTDRIPDTVSSPTAMPGSAGAAEPGPAPVLDGVDWRRVVTDLDAARTKALVAADERQLAAVDAPESPADARDRRLIGELRRAGAVPSGYSAEIVTVDLIEASGRDVVLRVVDRRADYSLIAASDGSVMERVDGRGRQVWHVTLTSTSGRWLVREAVPESTATEAPPTGQAPPRTPRSQAAP